MTKDNWNEDNVGQPEFESLEIGDDGEVALGDKFIPPDANVVTRDQIEHFIPVTDHILIRPMEPDTMKRGILMPTSVMEKPEAVVYGEVLRVGPGQVDAEGVFRKSVAEPGDTVIFVNGMAPGITLTDADGNDHTLRIPCESAGVLGFIKKPIWKNANESVPEG